MKLKLFEILDEGLKAKQRNAAHKILQSPPEKKAPNVSISLRSNTNVRKKKTIFRLFITLECYL